MRKCGSCGYLVLGDADACKHCGADLPAAVAAPVAAPVLVPVGAPVAMAPPVPPVPPPFTRADPPGEAATPPPPPLGNEYWTPPAPMIPAAPARRPRSQGRALLGCIVVVSMAFGWVAYGRTRNPLPPGTSDFVAGRGVPYSSPDHTFDAQFPMVPTVERRVIPVASTSVAINLAQAQTDDYEVVAASMVLPISVPKAQVESIVHEVLQQAAAAQDAKIERETTVDRDGASGVEVRAKVRDGYDARFLVLISGSRIYLLGTHAKRGTDRLYDALVSSLVMH